MSILERLHEQLDRDVIEYLKVARSHGHGVQIMQYVDQDGMVSEAKVTIDCRPKKSSLHLTKQVSA